MNHTTSGQKGQLTGSAADVYAQLFVPAIFARWPSVLLDAAMVKSGHRVLDVGCGTGVLAAAAADRAGRDGRVVGLDPNPPMLAVARRRPEPVEWRSGVAESIPYPDGAFDRVVSQFALMYVADRAGGLAEMARVTAPGGRVAVATWAAVADSPGYAALVDVVERAVGTAAAAAIREPFCLGDPAVLATLLEGSFSEVEVRHREGVARFDSIDSMVRAEIRGWTLSETIDERQFARLLSDARERLAFLTDADGGIEFAMPALVATGIRRTP